MTLFDQLEEQVAAAGCDRQVADFVDDQQRGAAEKANALAQRAFAFGFGELGDEVGKRDEVDEFAGPYRLDGEGGCEMAFAGSWRTSVILPGV